MAVRLAMRTAKWIYRHTPSAALRRLYFLLFCHLVRRRSVVAPVGTLTLALDLGELIDLTLYLGEYEHDTAAALARHCAPGSVVFDIGANVGAHTFSLADLAGSSGHVYAFEPTEYAFGKLMRNLSLNPRLRNVVASRVALSDHNAEEEWELRATWRPDGRHSSYRTRVEVVRLDDWCRRNAIERVDLIKLDVDGHEMAVLAGGRTMIATSLPTIVLEIGPYHFAGGGNPLVFLRERGYEFFSLSGERPMDLSAIREACAGRDSVNVVAKARR
ncbi:MAG TPA: FkbM family methyltransferase [Thermoanaerobaculia bacterium]|nr:FkbM family methyltransferase [Thermoanaerobaculia bacterium]